MSSFENSAENPEFTENMLAIIEALRQDPTIPFECSHGGEWAIGIYEVPRGCVALPGVEEQALCPQHVVSNGSFEGMYCVVDLSVNAAWSIHRDEEPEYCVMQDPVTGAMMFTEYSNRNSLFGSATE